MLHMNSKIKWWKYVLAGNRICPLCHREDDRHVPAYCPTLKDLNLKLVHGPPPTAALPAATPAPSGPRAQEASPGGHLALADEALSGVLSGPSNAPSGLVATLEEEEFALDDKFCWYGDKSGLDF
jgi:hypothetical protein